MPGPLSLKSPSHHRGTRPANILDIDDVIGKRVVSTRLRGNITVREENAAAALEVMSRFALDPRWLVYLPPTISPCETSGLPGLLEHPSEVFAYFRNNGVSSVVCQEKHMGSRAVVVVGKDAAAMERRFGVSGEGGGVCYTRTGRRFFEDRTLEAEFLEHVRKGISDAGLWDELGTDWVVLDSELMPWSLKAQELLREQYAAVGAASRASLSVAGSLLRQTVGRGIDAAAALARVEERLRLAQLYSASYARYCWPVNSLADIRLAPFHLLASEGQLHTDKDHLWHMNAAERLHEADPSLFQKTRIELCAWIPRTSQRPLAGGRRLRAREGRAWSSSLMAFVPRGRRGLVQPAIKCRGAEYLRIIYGPEYTLPENLDRLRNRSISAKRSLALREFALGVEGLRRFVEREPLYRVHECAFGVLALESEPVDPRL